MVHKSHFNFWLILAKNGKNVMISLGGCLDKPINGYLISLVPHLMDSASLEDGFFYLNGHVEHLRVPSTESPARGQSTMKDASLTDPV